MGAGWGSKESTWSPLHIFNIKIEQLWKLPDINTKN
jgi:hypothetical protein